MSKTLLDCGNCGPDFNAIRQMATKHFDVTVLQSHSTADTLETLRRESVDLVTVNRKLDCDYSDGLEVIKAIKSDPELQGIPIMLVTNYEEHQLAAIEEGCVRGFGKLAINEPSTHDRLSTYLG